MNRNSRVYFLKSLLQRLSIFRGRRRHQRLFAVLLDGAVETCPLANYCVAQRLQRIMYCKCNIKLQPGIAANSLTEVGCSDVVVIVCSGERCTEGERRAPAHNGVWGHSPQRGPGSKACCLSSWWKMQICLLLGILLLINHVYYTPVHCCTTSSFNVPENSAYGRLNLSYYYCLQRLPFDKSHITRGNCFKLSNQRFYHDVRNADCLA